MDYTLHYYDLVLVGVIAPLLLGAGIGYFTAIQMAVAVPVLGVLSIAVIGHGLFVSGPVEEVSDLTDEVEELPGPAEKLLE